ncbi:MAG: phosphoesterase [Bryobacterales bacterium]|nr:phosphoesterase [Bryobacterales bacterium]
MRKILDGTNARTYRRTLRNYVAIALILSAAATAVAEDQHGSGNSPRTPIQHVIVVVGENHTFDNVFGGYVPVNGQSVSNLLSNGIINSDGTPGPNFSQAAQQQAVDSSTYSVTPARTGPYSAVDQPNTTYAFGQPANVPDQRFPVSLGNGPFPISKYTAYDGAFTGDPVHRFFQMWQQYDGGRNDLFQWVAETVAIGPQNGNPVPTPANTYQGGVAIGFWNMSTGDAPLLKFMADHYASSDNYHQGVMGGTGANFIYLGTADVAFYSDGNGHPQVPFSNQIENPNPQPGPNNFYTQDGYRGGSYVNCSDMSQPGVAPIMTYLSSLRYRPWNNGNCAPGAYYLVNNYSPGFNPDGTPNPPAGPNDFRLPPQTLPTIADSLSKNGISWKYYNGGWNGGHPTSAWCSICNPLEFVSSVMTTSLRNNFADVPDLFTDLANGNLPAVSFVRPYEIYAGHPANSGLSFYEDFTAQLSNAVISNEDLFRSTAIFLTMDEGGGYYDSGYIQPIDFFGDGTRIPLIAISPYAKEGYVDHTYYDHGSILKFIEANWKLKPLSSRSRDNLPNPVPSANRYVPSNAPAIGDLMNLFDFGHFRGQTPLIIPQ